MGRRKKNVMQLKSRSLSSHRGHIKVDPVKNNTAKGQGKRSSEMVPPKRGSTIISGGNDHTEKAEGAEKEEEDKGVSS